MSTPVLVFGGFLTLFAIGVAYSFHYQKKRTQRFQDYALRHGYDFRAGPVDPTEYGLKDLTTISGRSEKHRMYNICPTRIGGYEAFLFDHKYRRVRKSRNSSSTDSVNETLLMIKGDFNLPKFVLYPEGGLMNLAKLLGLDDIEIHSDPEFSKRFIVAGERMDQIQNYFTPERTMPYRSLDTGVAVQGSGNTLTFILMYMPVAQVSAWVEKNKSCIENITRVA